MAENPSNPDDIERVRAKWVEVAQVATDPADRDLALKKLAALAVHNPVNTQPPTVAPSSREYGADIPEGEGPSAPLADRAMVAGSKALSGAESFAAGFNRRAMLGLPAKALAATGLRSEAESQGDMAANPTAAALGAGTGMGVDAVMPGGATNMLGRSAAAAAGRAAPGLESFLLGRIASTGAQGAAVGGAYGAADAATNGRPILPAAGSGALVGAGAGVAGQALGEGAKGVSKALHLDPWIQRYADAVDRGAYHDPEMRALPGGKEGMQAAAEQGLGRIMGRDAELGGQASQDWQAVASAEGQRPVNRDTVVNALEAGRVANTAPDSTLAIRDSVERRYLDALKKEPESPNLAGALARRQGMKADAAFNSPTPTPEQEAARDVYHAYRGGVREASPAMAAADDRFAQYATKAERMRDILFNTEQDVVTGGASLGGEARPVESPAEMTSAPGRPRVGKERQAVTTLKRVGDENEPGLRAKRYLDELYQQDPKFAEAIDFILAKKAKEATSAGLPMHALDLHGAAAGKGMLGLAAQNARFLGARVADPAAQAAAAALSRAPRMVPGLEMFLPPFPNSQESQ